MPNTHDAAAELAAVAAAAHGADPDVWLAVHQLHLTATPVTVRRHNGRTSRGRIVGINRIGFELDSAIRIPWKTAVAVAPASTAPSSPGTEVLETPEDARAAFARWLADPETPPDAVDAFVLAHRDYSRAGHPGHNA